MKNSNKLLLGLIVLLLAAPVWYAFLISPKLAKLEPKPEIVSPQTDARLDYPIMVDSFRYIVSDGVHVLLDTGQWQVTLQTYEDFRPHCTLEVRHDTLYISKAPGYSCMEGQWINVKVNAPRLSGLTVLNGGDITCLKRGASFNPDHLDIEVDRGYIRLWMDVGSLNLHHQRYGEVFLMGCAGRVNVTGDNFPVGKVSAFALQADTVYVEGNGEVDFEFKVNNYLNADLSGSRGDLAYCRNPVVEKKENSLGRVINANWGPK